MEVAPVNDEITNRRQTRQMERRHVSVDAADKDNKSKGRKIPKQMDNGSSRSRQSSEEPTQDSTSTVSEGRNTPKPRDKSRSRSREPSEDTLQGSASIGRNTPKPMDKSQSESPQSSVEQVQDSGTSISEGRNTPKQMDNGSSRSRQSSEEPMQDSTSEVGRNTPKPMAKRRSRSLQPPEEPVLAVSEVGGLNQMEKRQSTSRNSVDEPMQHCISNDMPDRRQTRQMERRRLSIEPAVLTPKDNSKESVEMNGSSDSMATFEEERSSQRSSSSAPNMPQIPEDEEMESSLNCDDASPESPPYASEFVRALKKSMKEAAKKNGSDSMLTIEAERNGQGNSSSVPFVPQIPEVEENESTKSDETNPDDQGSGPDPRPFASEFGRALQKSLTCRRSIHSKPVMLADTPFVPYTPSSRWNLQPTLKRKRSPSPDDESDTQEQAKRPAKQKPYLGRLMGLFRSDKSENMNKEDVPSKVGCAIM